MTYPVPGRYRYSFSLRHKEQKQYQKCKYLPEPWRDTSALMHCQAKEGMENCYVCMFISKVRQLLSVFTHQLPPNSRGKQSCESSWNQTAAFWSRCFRLNRLGPMWVLPGTHRHTFCAAWGNLLILLSECSSRRGSWQQEEGREEGRRTFFLNTLQRWISRTPPQQGSSQCKHSLAPSCVFTTQALEWALFRILPLWRAALLF